MHTQKSGLIFSKGIDRLCANEVKATLGITLEHQSFTYLGESLGLSKHATCTGVLLHNRISTRVNRWRDCALSLAGRGTLLQAVRTAIPQYWVGLNLLPKKYSSSISASQSAFLWLGSSPRRAWTPISWCTVAKPVIDGGLGI